MSPALAKRQSETDSKYFTFGEQTGAVRLLAPLKHLLRVLVTAKPGVPAHDGL